MRILVLGATGMLGHKLWQELAPRFDTYATIRGSFADVACWGLFEEPRTCCGVDAMDFATVEAALREVRPDAVVNCVGLVKQHAQARDPVPCVALNALFPHQLARCCQKTGARLLHVSTDCVFSGRKGSYSEQDIPDAQDLYGRSKLLGEVHGDTCLTLRTSIIGRELRSSQGLLEWFLAAAAGGEVNGFTRAVFSGFPTIVLAAIIAGILERHAQLRGLVHVASAPISKYELLKLLARAYGIETRIVPRDEPVIDRSLDGSLFCSRTGFEPPGWEAMTTRMAADPSPYETWRTQCAHSKANAS